MTRPLLGSPRSDVTILHYAEYLADVPSKRVVCYQAPLMRDGERVWVEVEELSSDAGIADYPGEEYFRPLMEAYLATGRGRQGLVGAGESYFFDAPDLVAFAARWMERNLVAEG